MAATSAIIGGITAGVSALVSVISSALNAAARAEKVRQVRVQQAGLERAARLTSAAHPPYYYKTLKARADAFKVIPEAYTVHGIKAAMNSGVIPTGYALSQLEEIGFKYEVANYRRAADKTAKEAINSFASFMETLIGVLTDAITGDDSDLRNTARAARVTKDMIDKFTKFVATTRAGEHSESTFNATIRILQGLLTRLGIEQDRQDALGQLQAKIGAAEEKELGVVQALAARFVTQGF